MRSKDASNPELRVCFRTALVFLALALIICCCGSYGQGDLGSLETVIYRNLSFNLSDGSVVDAQLTVPAATNGTFPGVLLIQDSGAMDMDEYHPAQVAGSNRSSRPFRQIAEYLSKRGFAVLRYNKRGVGLGGAVTNSSVLERAQFEDLRDDAERAFSLLSIQPEVDKNDLTLIGHGEGTAIASEIAATNSSVKQIVLLSPFALNLTEMMYFQIVIRPTAYAEEAVDVNHDGFLSVEEMEATIGSEAEPNAPLKASGMIERSTGTYRWYMGLDSDGDGQLSIQNELNPVLSEQFESAAFGPGPQSRGWTRSSSGLGDNLEIIVNISSSILILQGENDTQVPPKGALLLEQKLMASRHPDHLLITYPGLGHSFYPASGWVQPLGPMEDEVLSNLHSWLSERAVRISGLQPLPVQRNSPGAWQSLIGWVQSQIDQIDRLVGR